MQVSVCVLRHVRVYMRKEEGTEVCSLLWCPKEHREWAWGSSTSNVGVKAQREEGELQRGPQLQGRGGVTGAGPGGWEAVSLYRPFLPILFFFIYLVSSYPVLGQAVRLCREESGVSMYLSRDPGLVTLHRWAASETAPCGDNRHLSGTGFSAHLVTLGIAGRFNTSL